jgi:Rrf2 family protein
MKLSTKTRYGARAMLELADNYGALAYPVNMIAEKQNISERYLQNILLMLADAGLVKSVRGKKGGFILAKSPAEISIAEIVSVLEEGRCFVECSGSAKSCERGEICVMKDVWRAASETLYKFLGNITLKELSARRREKEGGMKIFDFSI